MEADSPGTLPTHFHLALCVAPPSVKARNHALNAELALLKDIEQAVRDALRDDEGPDEKVLFAVYLVARVAISLVEGARQLLPENVYAASALVRQLVEVEYLSWACGHDAAEAVDWLTSDRETRLRRWSPQRLRNRAGGRFDDQDYWDHCEAGGHPTPAGIAALHGPTEANPELVTMPEMTLYEVALHSTAICDFISHALPDALAIAAPARERAHSVASKWRRDDLAARWTGAMLNDPAMQALLLETFLEQMDGF